MTSVSHDNFSTADPYVGRSAPWSQEAEQAVLGGDAAGPGRGAPGRGAGGRRDVLPGGPPPALPCHARAHRAAGGHRPHHAARRAAPPGRAGDRRRPGVPRRAGGRGAHRGQHRVPRQDRPRQGHPPPPDRGRHLDHHRGLRRPLHRERSARCRRIPDLPDLPAARERRVHPHQGDAVADDGAHRNAPAERQSDYRGAERVS